MANDDKLLAELTRHVSAPHGAASLPANAPYENDPGDNNNDDDFAAPRPEEPATPSGGFDDYNQALSNARRKVAGFERAFAANRARKKALARLPFPWVQPVLRFGLWSTGAALAFFAAPADASWAQASTWLPALFVSLSMLSGEGGGRALSAFLSKSTWLVRLMHFSNLLLFTLLAIINFVILFENAAMISPKWFILSVAALAVVAAVTLPWFGASQKEYARLLKLVASSTRRQREAGRKARLAVDKLSAIHASHVRDIPASLKRS